MRFDLTDLRLFLNVHEAGTITGGAESTHMTLASASERIRGMEAQLGTTLLLRNRRGVHITPAGRTLVHHARLVLQQIDRMQGELGDYGKGLKGHIRLLCNTSALSEHLPEILSSFLTLHPGISIDLEERPSDDIIDALRNQRCDIGVAADTENLEGLETYPFRSDPLVLIAPHSHPLAQHTSSCLAEVLDTPFVGLAEGSALYQHIAHHARQQGKQLNYRIRLRSLETVCRMVGLGVGIAIVPQAVALRCAPSTKIKPIPLTDTWAARNLVLCLRQLEQLPTHTQQLVQHFLTSAPD